LDEDTKFDKKLSYDREFWLGQLLRYEAASDFITDKPYITGISRYIRSINDIHRAE
jgi:hypothetical protein